MENIPLITIITVSYNAIKTIEDTILSVLSQTYPNIEYIIIDGGSTDGTLDIIKKYQDRISYWVSEADKGIYDAMNKGWHIAKKESYILFIGADDKIISLPSVKFMCNSYNCIIYGEVELYNRTFKSICNWKLRLTNTIHHQALLIPKKIHIDPPFNLKYCTYADYDFNLRLYLGKNKFVKDIDFKSFALPNGASHLLNIKEMTNIVKDNEGVLYYFLSYIYLKLLQ
jgi:Glycosyltransferases involved in cell wall biogenesis